MKELYQAKVANPRVGGITTKKQAQFRGNQYLRAKYRKRAQK